MKSTYRARPARALGAAFSVYSSLNACKISTNILLWLGCWAAFHLGGAAAGVGSRRFGFFC